MATQRKLRTPSKTPTALLTDKHQVPSGFDDIAGGYDRLATMDPGYREHLRASARRLQLERGARVLDLCCGTGLSTEALVEVCPSASIIGLDASAGMLERARRKPIGGHVEAFVLGNAMDPGASGVDGPFDAILMAYGLRNMPDADASLAVVYDLLAPGGTVCFHEYVLSGLRSQIMWNAVTCGIIIPGGLVFSGRASLYRYLRRSVLEFDRLDRLKARIRRAGFVDVRVEPMTGWQRGILHSVLARRPATAA